MQRVVRSTLVGLSLIGLAACGDKVTNNLPPTDTTTVNQVTAVTVVPGNVQLAVGGTASLVATVTATPGITDRTVTWSSSNTAVATVSATGVVTGVAAGTAAIVATSKADTKVTGAAAVTVTSTPLVTVTIATINTTVPGTGSVPANLSNFGTASPVGTSQLDVTLNVEGAISGAAVIVTCGAKADTVTQGTFPNAAPLVDGDAASAPVTLSINTARLDANLVPRLNNGSCTIRGAVKTATGTQAITSNTALTLNNADVSIVSVTVPNRNTDNQGKVWFGNGAVTIAATPVFYSGRTAASVNIGLTAGPAVTGSAANTCTAGSPVPPFASVAATASGSTWTAVYPQTAAGVLGVACSNLVPTVSVVDNQGAVVTATQPFTVGTSATDRFAPTSGTFALDEQKPAPGAFPVANNTLQQTGPNGYVSGNFRFVADSAAGYTGATPNAAPLAFTDRTATCSPAGIVCNLDNGGVDKVTVRFQWRVAGAAASTYADLTSTSALNETATSATNQFRMITLDALGNADTTTLAASTFGVDKTPPTLTVTGPADKSTSQVIGGNGAINATAVDGLSGAAPLNLAAQTRLSGSFTSSSTTPAENTTNAPAGPCVIGRFNATAAASGAGALTVFDASGNARGFCTPVQFNTNPVLANNSAPGAVGYYTTSVIGLDAAGNRSAASVITVVDDIDNPVVASVDMPPSITGNATASFPASATDALDLVGSWATITFNTPTNGGGIPVALSYAPVAGPGVPFDNVLTRSATVTASVPNFIINMQVANTPAPVIAPVRGAANGDATNVTVTALDEVNRTGGVTVPFAPGVTLTGGASASWSTATFTGGVSIFASPATVSNGPAAGATAPSITGITVTAQGTSGTFANPFTAVQIWYQVGGAGPWFLAGTAGAGLSRDNGTNRFWDYTFNWDPPATAPNGASLSTNGLLINIRGIGINTFGDAVSTSGANVITIANP